MFLAMCFFTVLLIKCFGSFQFFQQAMTTSFIFDEYSFWLSFISCVVIFLSFKVSIIDLCFKRIPAGFSFFILFICCLVVFSSRDLFFLYVMYEFSLIPIIFIILKLGVYPDRLVSSIMMLIYTTIFSFPLIIFLLFSIGFTSSLFFSTFCHDVVPLWGSLLVLFSFSTKLPVYGLHFWLPMAHVEAPTSGSIVLAGILLKLGGCALFRFSFLVNYNHYSSFFLMYILVSLLVVSVVASIQSDFKRLVAFSSVVHMTLLLLSLFSSVSISYSAFLMVMVFHGLISPLIFLMVGSLYKVAGTRLLAVLHGCLSYYFFLSSILVFMFLMNIPTPPFTSFLAEVSLFLGLANYATFALPFIIFYVFLAIVFNVYWLSSVTFGSSSSVYLQEYKHSGLLEVVRAFYVCLFILFSVLLVHTF